MSSYNIVLSTSEGTVVTEYQPKGSRSDRYSFTSTADNLGSYWYNGALKAYIEVLSFDKILTDSKKRNRVLFEKLGI